MKLFFAFAVLLTNAFAQTTNPDLPNPELLTKKYLEEISGRTIGQTRFAHKSSDYYGRQEQQQQQQQEESGGSREIQEADVFKLGKKGNKELFLLNRSRGFQVVSFEDGLERPKLIGRFPVYNSYSSEMYYFETLDRVMILNTEWSYSENHWSTNYHTKVYLMDVKDSHAPKLIQELSVPGYLAESRMVGDVLYTITHSGDWDSQKAQITSVKLTGTGLSEIESADLHGDKTYVQTMNVMQEGSKFFVVSTSTRWNATGDTINVHDISSPAGDIKQLFSARARGNITERSMTFLHKDHLFAVSNYAPKAGEPLRVSVEAYPMEASTELVVSKENMRVSVGDTNGLHASLQDVRVSGDLLYAFWVPANNIDPFELFDISNPKNGIKHLGQLQFDGWISKAFPVQYQEREYVLGLGQVLPVTSENGKRYPQAKIFEIKKVNDVYKHEVVASLTIESDDFWSNLNTKDKYFEMVQEAPGIFNVLFPVTFKKNWKDGAKVVTANFNTGAITEGASVIGDQGWLNRIFLNKEVRALNAFSDASLETFRQDDLSSRGFAKAVSLLELSRNIVDFHVLTGNVGLQIVNASKNVEIRKVSLENSDAEKSEILGMFTIKGKYEWHKVKDNKVYVLTSFTKIVKRTYGENRSYDDEVFDYANLNVIDLSTSSESVERVDVTRRDDEQRSYYYFDVQAITTDSSEILKISNQFFRIVGNSLKKISVEDSCQYFFDAKSDSFSLQTVGQDIYAFTTFEVKAIDEVRTPESDEVLYTLPFTKKLTIDDEKVSCSSSINVPGRPVLSRDGMMVTNEFKSHYYYGGCGINYEYISDYDNEYEYNSGKTFSLKYNSPQEVTLMDILGHDITNGLFKDGFITYSSKESRLDVWRVTADGEFLAKPAYLNTDGVNSSMITVKNFSGRNFLFMKNEKEINLYEISKTHKVSKLPVTSSHDLNPEDGAAEYVFAINNIAPSLDLSRFHISQGNYGMTDIILK